MTPTRILIGHDVDLGKLNDAIRIETSQLTPELAREYAASHFPDKEIAGIFPRYRLVYGKSIRERKARLR
jgi:hypothetical protein